MTILPSHQTAQTHANDTIAYTHYFTVDRSPYLPIPPLQQLLLLLLLLYLIRRLQPCGYDALIYMLRTLGPVSSLYLSVFSTCILVRSSSFVSGFVRSPIRILLPDLYRCNKAAKADTFSAVHLQSLMNYISWDLILFLMAAGPPPLPSRRLLKVLLLGTFCSSAVFSRRVILAYRDRTADRDVRSCFSPVCSSIPVVR